MADENPGTKPMHYQCGYDEITGEPSYFMHVTGDPLPKGMVDSPTKVRKPLKAPEKS
jgi:hypothetical protein